jgi:hypothetical protein
VKSEAIARRYYVSEHGATHEARLFRDPCGHWYWAKFPDEAAPDSLYLDELLPIPSQDIDLMCKILTSSLEARDA